MYNAWASFYNDYAGSLSEEREVDTSITPML